MVYLSLFSEVTILLKYFIHSSKLFELELFTYIVHISCSSVGIMSSDHYPFVSFILIMLMQTLSKILSKGDDGS